MRQFLISLIGIVIIISGYLGKNYFAGKQRPKPNKEVQQVPVVFTKRVINMDHPIVFSASGNLKAKERIEIFSEVQGIFESSDMPFKAGVYFKKGASLLRLNSDEHRANLRSMKSNFYAQVVALLPDIRFDYPDVFDSYKTFVTNLDIEKLIPALPDPKSEKEALFIAGKGLQSLWYNIKNLEERLSKYSIYAPFSGVLTNALVDKGALVRIGQKLGEFINPTIYELEVSVNSSYLDLINRGSMISLNNVDGSKQWQGRVNRINKFIDPSTQTAQAYVEVRGEGLREGMYLEAEFVGRPFKNSFKYNRKLLVDNSKVFVVQDSTLQLREVEVVHFSNKSVIIQGLEDKTELLSRSLPGAYDGMTVNIFDKK